MLSKHKDKQASTVSYCICIIKNAFVTGAFVNRIEPAPPQESELHQSDVMTKSRGIKKIRWSSWTKEEDVFVLNAVKEKYSLLVDQPSIIRWSKLVDDERLPGRTGKQIRERWLNHLNPNLKNHQPFSDGDDLKLWEAHKRVGRKWTQISSDFFHLTRSENQIKNRWKGQKFQDFINKTFDNPNAYSDENSNSNPNLNYQGLFSDDDDLKLWEGQKKEGRKWTQISSNFFHSTHSGSQIKNRWYSAKFRDFINKTFDNPNAYSDENSNSNSNSSNKRKRDDDNDDCDDGGDDSDNDDDDDDVDDDDDLGDDDINSKKSAKKRKRRVKVSERQLKKKEEHEERQRMAMDETRKGNKLREEEQAKNDAAEKKLQQQRRRILPLALTRKKMKMGEVEQTGRQKQERASTLLLLLPSSSLWTKEEDDIVLNAVTNSSDQPFTDWSAFGKVGMLPGRTGRQIRDRWVDHLDPNLWKNRVDTTFTENEDYILWEAQKRIGKKWIQISTDFFHSTRTEIQIKNRWYSAAFRSFIYKQKIGPLKEKEEQDERRMLEEMKKEDKQKMNNATETERRQRRLAVARKKEKKDKDEIGQKEGKATSQPPSRNRKRSRDRRDEKESYDVNSDYDDDIDIDEDNGEEQQQQRHAVNAFPSSSRGNKGDASSSSSSLSSSCSSSSLPKKHTPSQSASSSSPQRQKRPRPRRRPQPRTSRPTTVFAIDDIHVAAPPEVPTATTKTTTTTLLSASHNSNKNVETDASTVARPGHHRRRGLPLALQQNTRQIATHSRNMIEKHKGVNIGDQPTGGSGSNDRINDEEESDDDNSDGDNDDGDDVEELFPQENNYFRSLDHKERWMQRFQQLVAYKEQHHNTMVSYYFKENPKLGRWVTNQRRKYAKDKLIPSRIDLLESIGFVWKPRKKNYNELWMGRFQELVAYKKQHKNINVPRQYKEYPKLGRWVSEQRQYYKKDKLIPSRINLLESIGFVWDGITASKQR